MAVVYMTEEGYKKLTEEVAKLESVDRPAVSQQIAEAREKGDLSENSEYDAAKEAQGMLEAKIAQMKQALMNAKIIDKSRIDTESVQILNKVKIQNKANGATMIYTLVPEMEANLKEGKLAISTPIAKALLGKKKGDIVEVQAPAGLLKFEIIDIAI